MNGLGGYYRLQTFDHGGPVAAYLASPSSRGDGAWGRARTGAGLARRFQLPASRKPEHRDRDRLPAPLVQRLSVCPTRPGPAHLRNTSLVQRFGTTGVRANDRGRRPAGPAARTGRPRQHCAATFRVATATRSTRSPRPSGGCRSSGGSARPFLGRSGTYSPMSATSPPITLRLPAGIGLRVNVADASPLNLRFDAAMTGDAELGFYLIIGEAIYSCLPPVRSCRISGCCVPPDCSFRDWTAHPPTRPRRSDSRRLLQGACAWSG